MQNYFRQKAVIIPSFLLKVTNGTPGWIGAVDPYTNWATAVTNSVIYFNTAPNAVNFTNTGGNTGLSYSCVIPAVDGTRNITNDPGLVNLDGGDYRLNGNSPCVNAGLNQNWMTNAVDLDGRSRIRYGTVDMGVYEVIFGGTIYGFH